MKITGVDLLVTRVSEHEDWRPAAIRPLPGGMRPTRCDDYVVVTIHTDEGIDGHAFGMGAKEGLRSAEAIKTVFVPELIGENPLDHEYLLQKLMRADRYSGHVPITAHGPIDVALWDITAKKAGLPLWRLLCGYRDRVPAYATSPRYDTIDEYVQGPYAPANGASGRSSCTPRAPSRATSSRAARCARRWGPTSC